MTQAQEMFKKALLKFIGENEGLDTGDIAKKSKIKANIVVTVVALLVNEKKIEKYQVDGLKYGYKLTQKA